MKGSPVYILSAARTPIGSFMGSLAEVSAPALGATAIRAAIERAPIAAESVQEVVMGHVLSAGIGQAPTRQAALGAGLADHIPCVGVSKVCGSGLEAVVHAARALALGERDFIVAGGMENMSAVPYYLDRAREGYRMGDGKVVDGMIHDGLWDPYGNYHMGQAAEKCAAKYALSREEQDEYAARSYARALQAQSSGAFAAELCSVSVPQRKGDPRVIDVDEEPGRGKPEKFAQLRPAFQTDGTITAANASSLNDGAAALVLASEAVVSAQGLKPLARILGWGVAAQAPEWFTTAPIAAIGSTLKLLGLQPSDIDLWEINEAFSCVTQAAAKELALPLDRVNVHGGAVALGHPIGASGARILTTLVHALKTHGKRRGLATLCIGGGEAVAVVVERG